MDLNDGCTAREGPLETESKCTGIRLEMGVSLQTYTHRNAFIDNKTLT